MGSNMWGGFLILCYLTVSIFGQIDIKCPPSCYCASDTGVKDTIRQAVCSGVMPPKMSDSIKHFTVRDANLPVLTPALFNSYRLIESLQMTQCGIKEIEVNTFALLSNIRIIRLSYNKITQLNRLTFDGVTTLKEFYCDNNKIKYIEPDTFSQLPNLEVLDLHNNEMFQVPGGKMPPKLYQFNLEGNNIQDIPPDFQFNSMREVNLCGNSIREFQLFQNTLSHLTELCIGDMPTVIIPQTFQSLKDLKELSLSSKKNPNGDLPFQVQNGIKTLVGLNKLGIEYYKLTNLSFIETLVNLKSLRLIHIASDVLLTEQTFANKKSLAVLDITSSPHLAKVIISSQMILQQLHQLTTLVIRDCFVHMVNHDLWRNTLVSLQHLDISNNPLHCDCRLSWMVNDQHFRKRIHFIDEKLTVCASPPAFASQQVSSLKFESCGELNGTSPPMLHPGDAVKNEQYRADGNKMAENTILYVVLGILIFLIIALIIAFLVYRCCLKRKGFENIGGKSVQHKSHQ